MRTPARRMRRFDGRLMGVLLGVRMNPGDNSGRRTTMGGRGRSDAAEGCQQALIAAAERRNFEANRLRKRKPRVLSRRAPG